MRVQGGEAELAPRAQAISKHQLVHLDAGVTSLQWHASELRFSELLWHMKLSAKR
jgi:hypothetical protein